MRNGLIILLMLLCPFASLANESPEKEKSRSGILVINITGFQSNKGEARVGLVNSKESYDNADNFRQAVLPVENKQVQYVVKNLEFGEYAFKVFHDENSNAELDSAIFGIPLESYGFSNNARSAFGPPAYSDAAFKFTSSGQKVFVKVK